MKLGCLCLNTKMKKEFKKWASELTRSEEERASRCFMPLRLPRLDPETAATHNKVSDNVPIASEPEVELAPSTWLVLSSLSLRKHQSSKGGVFSKIIKGMTKNYQSDIFNAVFLPHHINTDIEQAAHCVLNTDCVRVAEAAALSWLILCGTLTTWDYVGRTTTPVSKTRGKFIKRGNRNNKKELQPSQHSRSLKSRPGFNQLLKLAKRHRLEGKMSYKLGEELL